MCGWMSRFHNAYAAALMACRNFVFRPSKSKKRNSFVRNQLGYWAKPEAGLLTLIWRNSRPA